MISPLGAKVVPHIDAAIVKRLVFECLTYPINKGYRNSFIASCVSLMLVHIRSRNASPAVPLPDSPVLCFGAFRNEMSVIDQVIREHPDWHARKLDHRGVTGIDWRSVLASTPVLVLPFIRAAWAVGGARAVRNFFMPFMGYLVYQHLLCQFAALRSRPSVLVTNLVHPLSVAVHMAAKDSGLYTIFWEHAMTPRAMISKARCYHECHLNCEHTRLAFVEEGIPADRAKLIRGGHCPHAVMPARLPRRVGVCVNDLDSLSDTHKLLAALVKARCEGVLRVHDSDIRLRKLKRLAGKYGMAFSNAAQSNLMEFMKDLDVVIAGNSNVVLDCIRAYKPVIYFWPGERSLFDYYGIVSATGCLNFASTDELVSYLDQLRAKTHEATI